MRFTISHLKLFQFYKVCEKIKRDYAKKFFWDLIVCFLVFRLHRTHELRTIATDYPGVCQSVSLSAAKRRQRQECDGQQGTEVPDYYFKQWSLHEKLTIIILCAL